MFEYRFKIEEKIDHCADCPCGEYLFDDDTGDVTDVECRIDSNIGHMYLESPYLRSCPLIEASKDTEGETNFIEQQIASGRPNYRKC